MEKLLSAFDSGLQCTNGQLVLVQQVTHYTPTSIKRPHTLRKTSILAENDIYSGVLTLFLASIHLTSIPGASVIKQHAALNASRQQRRAPKSVVEARVRDPDAADESDRKNELPSFLSRFAVSCVYLIPWIDILILSIEFLNKFRSMYLLYFLPAVSRQAHMHMHTDAPLSPHGTLCSICTYSLVRVLHLCFTSCKALLIEMD